MTRFPFTVALTLLLALLGCPSEQASDDDTAADDDSADDPVFEYSGLASDVASGDPIEGLEVEVGEVVTQTDASGEYLVELDEGPPQQVSFIDSAIDANTYVDCEQVHDHSRYDWGNSTEFDTATVEMTVVDPSEAMDFRVRWISFGELGGGTFTYSYSFSAQSGFEECGDGVYCSQKTVTCLDSWAFVVTRYDGNTLIDVASEDGDSCIPDQTIEVTVTLGEPTLDTFTWDGLLDGEAEEVSFSQGLELGGTTQWISLWGEPPTDEPVEVPFIPGEIGSATVSADAEYAESEECEYASSGETFEDVSPGDVLTLGPLLDAVPPEPTKGLDEWGARPDLTLERLPEEAEEWYVSVYSYTFEPDFEYLLYWSIQGDASCPADSVTYPAGLDDAPPDIDAGAYLVYYVDDRSASCSRSFVWPEILK